MRFPQLLLVDIVTTVETFVLNRSLFLSLLVLRQFLNGLEVSCVLYVKTDLIELELVTQLTMN